MNTQQRVLIWDLPTRISHWLLAGGVLVTASLSLMKDDVGRLFPYHAIVGLATAFVAVLRILWGVFGSRYARFSSFLFSPTALINYFSGLLRGVDTRFAGHNPASAWVAFAMIGLVLGLAITGFLISQGGFGEDFEEVHEFLAYALLAAVGLHISGVVLYMIRHRENIATSMIHGCKEADAAIAINSSHPLAAILFCIVSGAWGFGLFANYDAATQTTHLPFIGTTVHIGENEHERGESHKRFGRHHHEEDD